MITLWKRFRGLMGPLQILIMGILAFGSKFMNTYILFLMFLISKVCFVVIFFPYFDCTITEHRTRKDL